MQRIHAVRATHNCIRLSGCLHGPRKRLQDKFGSRWKIKILVKAQEGDSDTVPATTTDEPTEIVDPRGRRKRSRRTVKVVRVKAVTDGQDALPGGQDKGVERDTPVDVPKYRFGKEDDFEKPWHVAQWAPHDPDGPTVVVNVDSPILQ